MVAEIIPYEPEPGNSGVGIVHSIIISCHFYCVFPCVHFLI